MKNVNKIAVIDLFCGAGGTTTGVERANCFGKKISKVIACVNHDPVAIESHAENHKGVLHFTEDIRELKLNRIVTLVKKYRQRGWKVAIWASLECTNFSNAKGGQPRDADSRTLAEHLYRYVAEINPDYVLIENVVEFMSWGPLDANGKPESKTNGRDYLKWIKGMCSFGFNYDYAILNSADYGAYTSRKRYFGMFGKDGMPVVFPESTHAKKPVSEINLFNAGQLKWKPVKEVLDLDDEGRSIFNRDKSLSEKTLLRIYAGLVKYVAGGDTSYLTQRNSGNPNSKIISVDSPARTLTQTAGNQDLVTTNFLTKYHGTGQNLIGMDDACSTITTKDRLAKVNCEPFIDKCYSGTQNHQSINDPSGTIMTKDKYSLVTPKPYLMSTHYSNVGRDIEQPAPTLTASRRHNYIVNPAWGGNPGNVNEPCFTIVARQDKAPLYLIAAEVGKYNIPVYDTDSAAMVMIKQFMAAYNIVDIKMRMLKVSELLKIQGFPDGYILKGNQSQQKKFIGNSVVPVMAQKLIESIYSALNLKEVA